MYVCLCKGITDGAIKDAVLNGAGNLKAVKDELGVASQCSKCARCAHEIICQVKNETIGSAEPALFFP